MQSHINKFKSLYPHSHRTRDCNEYWRKKKQQKQQRAKPSNRIDSTQQRKEVIKKKEKKYREKTGSIVHTSNTHTK